ncbi:hypothetical protein [Demequina sp.]|uniref:hypothetical protein n=1 Tax=Demequina sp. TaxID=2050685 RepID=UPI0025BC60F8|nr:hypothetical protein [Demequina sp.]
MRSATTGITEYDRFGPWIDEVKEPDDVPRLYRRHGIDLSAARLVLKVPRNISRRNANPDMDLYDHLLVLGQDQLTVLSRRTGGPPQPGAADSGKGYDVLTIQLADVVAIRNAVNLLDGRLTVATSAGASITVPYNGSAAGTVGRLVSALKEVPCATPASPVGVALLEVGGRFARPTLEPGTTTVSRPTPGTGPTPTPGPIDTFLVSAWLVAQDADPRLAVWAAHGHRPLTPDAPGLAGIVQRAKHAFSPMTLHGCLIAADGHALELYGRHSWLVRGRDAIYSLSHVVIPFGAPDHLALSPHPLYPDAAVATIGAGQWREEIAVPRDSVAAQLLSEAARKSR